MEHFNLITSEEVNYLVYKYLQESGFSHTAFTFGYESFVLKNFQNDSDVPPGALITFLQKGLQFYEVESHLEDTLNCKEPFSLLKQHICRDSKEINTSTSCTSNEVIDDSGSHFQDAPKSLESNLINTENQIEAYNNYFKFQPNCIESIESHHGHVSLCLWSPNGHILGTAASDSSAFLLNVTTGTNSVLSHNITSDYQHVTSIGWSSDSTLFSTGTFDGSIRIWDKEGQLKNELNECKSPASVTKFNKKGDQLLGLFFDGSSILWDLKLRKVKQQKYQNVPILDGDWRNNTSYITCGIDSLIHYSKIGDAKIKKTFRGHSEKVNCVRWDRTGTTFGSCSDDTTVKLWNLRQEKCLSSFEEHSSPVPKICWNPSYNPNYIGSASEDSTVRIWVVGRTKSLYTFDKHQEAVTAISFSPNGLYLASVSMDRKLFIWSIKSGYMAKSYEAPSKLLDCDWNKDGNRLAITSTDGLVRVLY